MSVIFDPILGQLRSSDSVSAASIGLGNVDNTSDANKPVSSATQTALDAKANSLGSDDNYVTDAEKVKLGNLSGVNSGNQTIVDNTTPSTQAFGDSASVGTAVVASRADHKHAMPATPTSVSGNAGTATALATPRAINGINFDGTGPITIPNLFLTLTSADSVGTGLIVGITYGESIVLGAPLYLKASDGKVYNADANGSSTYPVIGLALATAGSGINNVLLFGIYQFASAHSDFTVGGKVYLSTTVGTFTQTQPSATDDVIQACGVALAADTILFNPSPDYITHT